MTPTILQQPVVDSAPTARYIDKNESVTVAIIGGGIAGILAGILLPIKVPNIVLTIYEKNDDLGGTWYENIYPGVRCDIPGHVYQATFAPNRKWTEKFPRGHEVRDYWQGLARDYGVYEHVKFSQEVNRLEWKPEAASWEISLNDRKLGTTSQVHAHFVITAIGRFNSWRVPHYPGMEDFKGSIVHTANWPKDLDVRDKTVAVIGNGSSGIQILPNIQPIVKKIDHYARNQTWIAPSWAGDEDLELPKPGTEAMERLQDPTAYLEFQKGMANNYWRRFNTYMKDTKENEKLRQACMDHMKKATGDMTYEEPEFSPNCRRLTPGPGYLDALKEDNVEYIQTRIKKFSESGIKTEDGRVRATDVVICATGFNVDMAPPFSIVSNGEDLAKEWRQDGKYGFPFTYFGMASPGFPNIFFIAGPHGTGLSGLVPHSSEVQVTYVAKVLRKVARQGIKTIVPTLEATKDFQEYSDTFFKRTVLSQNCSSWYNGGIPGGRIHGLWPGSAAHATLARKEPRWEDFEYTYKSTNANRFWSYFGNGVTEKELAHEEDITAYLRIPDEIDLKLLHEEWWSYP